MVKKSQNLVNVVCERPLRIHHNREKSEQFLKQNAFLTCTWRFLKSNTLGKYNSNWKKINCSIGAIAAAAERCIDKVVMQETTEYDDVITCKHSYRDVYFSQTVKTSK